MRLQAKFSWVILPIVTTALVLIGTLTYHYLQQNNKLKYENEASTILSELAHIVDDEITSANANMQLLASDALFQKYASTSDEQQRYEIYQKPVLERIRHFQKIKSTYPLILYVLPDGYTEIYSNTAENPKRVAEHNDDIIAFGQQLKNGRVGRKIFKHSANNEPYYYFIKPILLAEKAIDNEKKLRGYLAFVLDFDEINQWIKTRAEAYGGSIRIYYNDDVLLSSAEIVERYNHTQGIVKTVSLTPTLMAEVFLPYAYFQAEYNALFTELFWVMLVSILIVSVAIFLFFRFLVVQPLSQLEASTEHVGSTNQMSIKIIETQDEIGFLSRALHGMSENIAQNSQKIHWLAHQDSLTELPNRRYFMDLLKRELAKAKRQESHCAVVFMDLDNFKAINDSLGHHYGDLLLRSVARCVRETLRAEDVISLSENGIVSRMGGDEFTIILADIKQPEDAAKFASRLVERFKQPFILEDETVNIGCSMGITIYPNDGETVEDLVKAADLAMYKAKKSKDLCYEYFTPELNHLMMQRLTMERRLRKAIKEKQFVLYYQPQVDLISGRVVGVESLIRWIHPEDGLIPPNDFVPLAEDLGLICDIGQWVIEEACAQAERWTALYVEPLKVSVNISSLQFDTTLVQSIASELSKRALSPEWFGVEITESILLSANDENKRILESIQALGVKVALDDFGTGYASLSYLLNFPVDFIKIDRSFVMNLEQNDQNIALVSAIIALGRAVSKQVIAEGAEELGQIDILKQAGCALVQGYYYSKPLPADELEAFIAKTNTTLCQQQVN